MIDDKNYLYISNDYTNWKKINLSKDIDMSLDHYTNKNTLEIIGDIIYICDSKNIYYTDYKNIEWKKNNNIYSPIGIIQTTNNNFIINSYNNLYITKDGGKTFDYLLSPDVIRGDKGIFDIRNLCFSSDQIYFELQNEIYTKSYD
jgi:hypothetical protein